MKTSSKENTLIQIDLLTDFLYDLEVAFVILILLVVGGACVVPLTSDSFLAWEQLHNSTMKHETRWWMARAWFRLSAYIVECIYCAPWL